MHGLRALISFTGLGLLLSCSGGSGTGTTVTGTTSNLSVHLVGAPGDGVQALSIAIQKVELNGPNGWVTVASPNAAFSLVSLVDGSSAALTTTANLAPGTYTLLRLTLGQGSTAQLVGGNALSLVAAAQVFVIPFNLTLGSNSADLTLILDPGRSVQPRGTTLLFAPEWRAVDRNASGSITGKFTDSLGQPLAGALVTAQYFQAFGEPVIQRRALTHADGSYTLDLLPFGIATYAVCFPQLGVRAFDPKASGVFTPQTGTNSTTFATSFTPRTDLSSTSGTVSATAGLTQGDEIQLFYGPIQAGGITQSFIISTSPGVQQGTTESWGFTKLPAGSTYQLRAKRRTWASDGTFVEQTRFSEDYGFLTNMNFSYDFFF
jgi:hypothetical protein